MAERLHRAPFVLAVLLSLVVLFAPKSQIPTHVEVSDKVIHAALFALLALTGLLARVRPAPLLLALVVYAGASEVLQATLPINRDADAYDALTDTAGAALGTLIGVLGRRVRSAHDG